MPEVKENAEVTLVVLVYRSLKWLDWCMEGVDRAWTETNYRWLVVANDATAEVAADPRIDIDFRNDDPSEFYINRVYRAWNEGVLNAPTQLVCMLNSDMWPYNYWLEELVREHRASRNLSWSGYPSVPTSLLVESGRIPSAMPEYVKDFGLNPDEFDGADFGTHANSIRRTGVTEDGSLFMPILVDRQEFLDVGGYPEGNPPGTTGDKDLISRYEGAGYKHVTAMGSVVYHCQEGEQRWPK